MAASAHGPGTGPPSCPPMTPSLLLPAFPGAALLVTSADAPGSKLIIKLKREGPVAKGGKEMAPTQTFFLTGMPLGLAAPRQDGSLGPGVRTVLVAKTAEDPGGTKPRMPETVPLPRAPPPSNASFACTSKGVYENYRRWQRYKALARRHFPSTPDTEALACFFIPVLRSLARLRPDMTLEEGVPRAVQEWERSSNFERMIFYEMAEKFMEFEVEEEQQIQKMKLVASCSQFQALVPKSTQTPLSPAAELSQQGGVGRQGIGLTRIVPILLADLIKRRVVPEVYIPKKSASKNRQPRRRQRHSSCTATPGAPQEIPAEAVHQYAEIMEALDTSWEEEEDEKKEQGGCRNPQNQEDGMFPDPGLLQYIDQLCGDEEFVSKVEAVIHPQFMANLLSVEKSQDPVDLEEALEEELNLTPSQLKEKRLLVLSGEDREASFCPISHSDSTPSQSEEEDEVSHSGKGEETSCKATKRPSSNKALGRSQPEIFGPGTISLLAPSSHQHLGKTDSSPKAVRTSLGLSPHKCGSHDSHEERALPALENTDERETQNLMKQDQVGQAKGIPPHAHWEKISPNIIANNSLTEKPSSPEDMVGQGIQRPHCVESGRKDGRQGKVKGQEEVQRALEQVSQTAKAKLHEENLESAHSTCGKQDGAQQREVKLEKTPQAIWEGKDLAPKRTECTNENINKMLLRDHTSEKRALQKNLNRYEEQLLEKVTGQFQSQVIRETEDTSGRTELDNEGSGMKSQRDSQINQFSKDLVPLEGKKQDGCQREVLQNHDPLLVTRKGPKSVLDLTVAHRMSTEPRGRSLSGQEHQMSMPAEPARQPDAPETKVSSPTKSQIRWEKTKCAPVKRKRSSGKALPISAVNLAPSTSTVQDGRQPTCPTIMETDQKVNYPFSTPSVELSGRKGNHLASADSNGIRVRKGQQPRISTEHPPFCGSSELESTLLNVQKDPGTGMFQKIQCSVSDQDEVTARVGNQPDIRQTRNPTLYPSDHTIAAEDVGNCGPSGDHTPVPTRSRNKAAALLPKSSSSDASEKLNPRSECGKSREVSSEGEVKSPGQLAERRDLPEPPTKASATLHELSGRSVDGSNTHSTKEEKQAKEKDKESEMLSSFSSLLASKLSLSPHVYLVPCPKEREDAVPSSPIETGKPSSETMNSVQVQMPQYAIVLLSKNIDAHPTVHCSHKRKSRSTDVRRSKRLRSR